MCNVPVEVRWKLCDCSLYRVTSPPAWALGAEPVRIRRRTARYSPASVEVHRVTQCRVDGPGASTSQIPEPYKNEILYIVEKKKNFEKCFRRVQCWGDIAGGIVDDYFLVVVNLLCLRRRRRRRLLDHQGPGVTDDEVVVLFVLCTTHAADGDGVYTATSGHGPAGDAVHGLAVQKGEDLPAGAVLATGKRRVPTIIVGCWGIARLTNQPPTYCCGW